MSMAIAVVLNASATTPANTNFLIFFLLILLKTDGQFRAGGDEQHGGKEAANNPSTHNDPPSNNANAVWVLSGVKAPTDCPSSEN